MSISKPKSVQKSNSTHRSLETGSSTTQTSGPAKTQGSEKTDKTQSPTDPNDNDAPKKSIKSAKQDAAPGGGTKKASLRLATVTDEAETDDTGGDDE